LVKFDQIAIGTDKAMPGSPPVAETLATLTPCTKKTALACASAEEAISALMRDEQADIRRLTGAADGHRCSTIAPLKW